jgi:transketolase
MALALKMQYGYLPHRETPRVYCVLSDGEIQEGQVWEAFNLAVRRQLDNLIFILDRNHVQIENYVSQLATYGPLAGRFEGFGLTVLTALGNDHAALARIFAQAQTIVGAPVLILAETTAGKGVSFMENDPEWHDKVPTQIELRQALAELRSGGVV